jgi:Domain of unknown function (DUF5060)
MKNRFYAAVLILFVLIMSSCDSGGITFEETTDHAVQYERFFIPFTLEHVFDNPYNPADIKVDAFITAPDGKTLIQPCFFKSGMSGMSGWEARFTPRQSGTYTYYLQVENDGKKTISETRHFSASASDGDGFLGLNKDSWYSLRFDSGRQYRGVGLNICWDMESEWKYPYETYFKAAGENNVNFVRLWMCSWNLPLEWTTIRNYTVTTDALENWDKTFAHTNGLIKEHGLNPITEDENDRIRFPKESTESIIYNIENIHRFKIKMFYQKDFSRDKIKVYGSTDNQTYSLINTEYSESRNTQGDWYRIYLCYISDMPDGSNYLKIEFADNMSGNLRLGSVWLEHGAPTETIDAPGLGRYYTKTAERMDELLQMSGENGVYLMLAFDYHGIFKDYIDTWASNAEWRQNPYNKVNGGPCATPAEFFTNAEAKQYYKNRLRYMVARWGYSTNIAVWEFWNEIDNAMEWQKIPAADIAAWHKEMAVYLRDVDPYNHIISTSVANRPVPGLWDLDEIEITQHHPYGPTEDLYQQIKSYEEQFNKADVLGEFALSWRPPGQGADGALYEGAMHNGLWRGMFSPTPILPMTWWWEWHLAQKEYFHFKWADKFVKKMTLHNDDLLQELIVESENKNLETMALKSASGIFAWILNRTQVVVNISTLKLDEGDGLYTAKWYNPWDGAFTDSTEVAINAGVMSFNAVKLDPARDMALWVMGKK